VVFRAAIEAAAHDLGAEYSPADAVAYERARSHGEAIYLAGDGHWSPLGAAVVAAELARTLAPETARAER